MEAISGGVLMITTADYTQFSSNRDFGQSFGKSIQVLNFLKFVKVISARL